jgi:hypothetical protein
MTKYLFIFCMMALLRYDIYAQAFKGGIMAGPVVSQVLGDDNTGYNKMGLSGGLYVFRNFGEKWIGQMEMRYVQKGSQKNANPEKGDYTYWKLKLDYFEIPLLAKYVFDERIQAEAGTAFGYLMNASFGDNGGTLPSFWLDSRYRKFEHSVFLGGTYKYKERIGISTRWCLSVMSIRKETQKGFNLFNLRGYGMWNKLWVLSFTWDIQ